MKEYNLSVPCVTTLGIRESFLGRSCVSCHDGRGKNEVRDLSWQTHHEKRCSQGSWKSRFVCREKSLNCVWGRGGGMMAYQKAFCVSFISFGFFVPTPWIKTHILPWSKGRQLWEIEKSVSPESLVQLKSLLLEWGALPCSREGGSEVQFSEQ